LAKDRDVVEGRAYFGATASLMVAIVARPYANKLYDQLLSPDCRRYIPDVKFKTRLTKPESHHKSDTTFAQGGISIEEFPRPAPVAGDNRF
jgi:hypothetical protein